MMVGFGLLMGHLIGDYLIQNDWMAANKTNRHPGPYPVFENYAHCHPQQYWHDRNGWVERQDMWFFGLIACTVHCLLYTLAVWVCSFRWMPWWGLLVCFAAHWPIDRFRLARVWMERISGQKIFATGPLAPWSVIVVDNILHLLTLYLIALAAF